MTLEGSRKFIAMWLTLLCIWVTAKFGPSWGGIFTSAQIVLVPVLGGGLYMLINYLLKSTKDGFAPDNWLAGKKTFLSLFALLLAPILTGMTVEFKDAVTQTITLVAEVGTPALYMIFQALSDKKLAAAPIPTVISLPSASYGTAPSSIPVTSASPSAGIITAPVPLVKDRIKAVRATIGSNWEMAKEYLLGTFKDRWEYALKRMLMNNPGMSTIEACRRMVLEVVGIQIDEKTCQALGNIPGFLGAISAHHDITIIGDLLTAIDKMPELAYMKKALQKRAEWYAVKSAVDEIVTRIQQGQGNEDAKKALQEFGLTLWQIEKSQWSGGDLQIWWSSIPTVLDTFGFRQFDAWMLAGVDPITMDDV